jgi:hypothetical protein
MITVPQPRNKEVIQQMVHLLLTLPLLALPLVAIQDQAHFFNLFMLIILAIKEYLSNQQFDVFSSPSPILETFRSFQRSSSSTSSSIIGSNKTWTCHPTFLSNFPSTDRKGADWKSGQGSPAYEDDH